MDYAQYFPVKKYLEGIRILGVTTQMKLSGFLMLPPITKTSDKTHFEIFLKLTLTCFFILYFKHCFKKCVQQIAGLFLLMLYFFLLHKNFPLPIHVCWDLPCLLLSMQFHCPTDHSSFPFSFHSHGFQTVSFLQLLLQAFSRWLKSTTIS